MTFGAVPRVPLAARPGDEPPGGVSDGRVDLSWTNPTTPFDQVKVVRKARRLADRSDRRHPRLQRHGDDRGRLGLTNGVAVQLRRLGGPRRPLSSPALISATPQPTPPGPVTNVVANPGDTQVALTWTNPLGALDAIKVVRKPAARRPTRPTARSSTTAPGRP